MALFIEISAPDGTVTRVENNLADGGITALPGHQYRLINDEPSAAQTGAKVRRSGESLIVEIPETNQLFELNGFFLTSENGAGGATFSLAELGGTQTETITPESEPIAALNSGGFLLWTSPALGAAAPQDPDNEFAWRPIAGVAAGVGLIGAAAGGGGGGSAVASDSTPPTAPVINTELNTSNTKPVINGTADAGSAITITIDIGDTGQRVTYTTTADNNGAWSVDLANDAPFSGALPAAGLPTDSPSMARAIATDAAGNVSPVANGTITIDVTAPIQTASVTSVSSDAPTPVDENGVSTSAPDINLSPGVIAPAGLTNDSSPTIRGTVSGPLEDGDQLIIWRGEIAVGQATLRGLDWTFTDTNVPQGTHIYSARVTDLAGNGSAGDNDYTITIDGSAPSAPVINIVSDNDILTFADAQQPVLVSGTAEANAVIAISWGAVTQQTNADANGTWSLAFNDAQLPGNGNQPITASATDSFGNVSTLASRPVNVVTGLPSAPVFNTDPGSVLSGAVPAINAAEASGPIFITGRADPGNTVVVTLEPVNGGQAISTTITANAQGIFAVSFAPAALPEGSYNAQAVATDVVGNVTSGPALQILVDTIAPTAQVRIDSVTDDADGFDQAGNGALINDNSPTLNGSVNGAAGDEVVQILRDGQVIGTAPINGGAWQYTDNGLAEDTYGYSASVTDVAGNTGPASTPAFSLTVDTTPPAAPTLNVVAADNVVTGAEAAGGVSISGTAAANSQINVDWAGLTRNATADGNGNWSVTYNNFPNDGLTQVSANVRDAAGNTASAFQTVRVDTQPPPNPVVNPVAGDNNINAAEAANGIEVAGRAEAGATIEINWAGTVLTTNANGSGFWSASFIQPPAQGSTDLTVRAIDGNGNSSGVTRVAINVDSIAPGTPTINPIEGDGNISFAEAADGIQVNGQAEAGTNILVSWAGATRTTQTDGNGNWAVTFDNAPAQGQSVVEVVARDATGNTSVTASTTVTANSLPPPSVPTFASVEGDNQINAAEAADGIQIVGQAQANTTINVLWEGVARTTTANGSGFWSVNYAQAPTQGNTSVRATATNANGLSSGEAVASVFVDTLAPATPSINPIEGDGSVTFPENVDGIQITGNGEAGSNIRVSWAGVVQTAQANPAGNWAVTFDRAPTQGQSTVEVVAQDAAGNTSASANATVNVNTAQPPSAPTINQVADDGIVNIAEAAAGVRLSGTAPGGAQVLVSWGTTQVIAQAGSGGGWVVDIPAGQVPAASADVSAIARNAGGDSPATTRAVQIDRSAPAPANINIVEGDDTINLVEAADGVPVTGTAEAGATVQINWGGQSQSDLADASGNWAVNFATVPAASNTTITAQVRDAAGNPGASSARTVTIDNTPAAPAAPTINPVETNNQVNAAEAADGVVISGSAQAGASIVVTWGATSLPTTATGGQYSVTFGPGQVPATDTAVSVVASNAGGSSPPATQPVSIDTDPPPQPVIGQVEGDDDISAAEAADGIAVTGTAEANSTIVISWLGLSETTAANNLGVWGVNFASAPAQGASDISAVATDAAGNDSATQTRGVTVNTVVTAQTVTIADVLDDVAPAIGSVANGGTTDDNQPTVLFTLDGPLATGASLLIFLNGALATTQSDDASYTPPVLSDGQYEFSAQLVDFGGNRGILSDPYQITIDTTP